MELESSQDHKHELEPSRDHKHELEPSRDHKHELESSQDHKHELKPSCDNNLKKVGETCSREKQMELESSRDHNQRELQTEQVFMCSRCLVIETKVTPLAWTLSTLGQTNHDSVKEGRSLRSEMNLHSMNTNELLKQYRHLQVSIHCMSDI